MDHESGWLRKLVPVLSIAAIIIVLDQWTKDWIRETIPMWRSTTPIEALEGYFAFEHVPNHGAAFGILQNQTMLFSVIAVVVAIAILVYVYYLPTEQMGIRYLLGLQLGGAIGNLVDRIFVNIGQVAADNGVAGGYVTDFIKMGIPDVYYWPNYNIADSAIVIGVIGLAIFVVLDDIRQQRERKSLEHATNDA